MGFTALDVPFCECQHSFLLLHTCLLQAALPHPIPQVATFTSLSAKSQLVQKSKWQKKKIFVKYHNVSVKYSQSKAESPRRDAARLACISAPGLNFPLAKCLCSSESANKKTRARRDAHGQKPSWIWTSCSFMMLSSYFSTFLGSSLPLG